VDVVAAFPAVRSRRSGSCPSRRTLPVDYNTIRPQEALWNRPIEVHLSLADPRISNFPSPHSCQLLDARQSHIRRLRQTGEAHTAVCWGVSRDGSYSPRQPLRWT
jgi:hypothetical protein